MTCVSFLPPFLQQRAPLVMTCLLADGGSESSTAFLKVSEQPSRCNSFCIISLNSDCICLPLRVLVNSQHIEKCHIQQIESFYHLMVFLAVGYDCISCSWRSLFFMLMLSSMTTLGFDLSTLQLLRDTYQLK